jgi:hypothetical protein
MRLVDDKVLGHMGDVLAERIRGEWHTKDEAASQFLAEQVELVRARDSQGKFTPDDPTTPEVNEAWVKKPTKRVVKK